MRKVAPVLGATALAAAVVGGAHRRFGPESRAFAFIAVWAPMAWLGTISRFVRPTLPAAWHRLRPFEESGRVYELVGVRIAKSLVRRGPIARFNPDLHLPEAPTSARLHDLEGRMEDAEATHVILFAVGLGVAAHAGVLGRWRAARWMVFWNVVLNGYPALLQRYNRALLRARFPDVAVSSGITDDLRLLSRR